LTSDIRVWDISNGSCVQKVKGHVADVYGICNISTNPLIFISTSRDNTMMMWSMEDLIKNTKWDLINGLIHNNVDKVADLLLGNSSGMAKQGSTYVFTGLLSQSLKRKLKKNISIEYKWKHFLDFFSVIIIDINTALKWNSRAVECCS
jgi:WD40 repeat protein